MWTRAVIWKASLCEGAAPQFVDKLASSEWFSHTQVVCRHSDALLFTLAGEEILCWPLPTKVCAVCVVRRVSCVS